MDWVASGLTWIGNLVLIRKKAWWCFLIFACGNTIWFFYWMGRHEWAAMILVATFLAQNAYGIYEWRKKR